MMCRECDCGNAADWFHHQYCSFLCVCPFHPCFCFCRIESLCGSEIAAESVWNCANERLVG